MAKGILIDYNWCSGCQACKVACQKEHGLPPERSGIVINQVGPWCIEGDTWQYEFVPVPTDECDLCAARTSKGKLPTCMHHCQANVITIGDFDDLAKAAAGKAKHVLYTK